MPVLLKIVRFPARLVFALLALSISVSIVRGANQGRPTTNPFMRTRQFRMGRIAIEVGSRGLGHAKE
jgi:hypothetical protein